MCLMVECFEEKSRVLGLEHPDSIDSEDAFINILSPSLTRLLVHLDGCDVKIK